MPKSQLSTLKALVQRSPDIGNGWRECSEICWDLVLEHQGPEENPFELDHYNRRVRIREKPKKPSMDDLLNQIYEWRERATDELRRFERHELAEERASNLLR